MKKFSNTFYFLYIIITCTIFYALTLAYVLSNNVWITYFLVPFGFFMFLSNTFVVLFCLDFSNKDSSKKK